MDVVKLPREISERRTGEREGPRVQRGPGRDGGRERGWSRRRRDGELDAGTVE